MDDFPGLLPREFGFRPQGKSAPMAASRGTTTTPPSTTTPLNFGIGSDSDFIRSSSSTSNRTKSSWNSTPINPPSSFLDDQDTIFSKLKDPYEDVFGGPPKYNTNTTSSSSFEYDLFKDTTTTTNTNTKTGGGSNSPVYDKPVYDDEMDILHGVKGVKTSSSSADYVDVFASPKKNDDYDDFLGLGKQEPESSRKRSGEAEKEREMEKDKEKDMSSFDDLIPGFGGSSPNKRTTSETTGSQKPTVPLTKSASSIMDEPFVVLEPVSAPAYVSAGLFTEPTEPTDKPSKSGSVNRGGLLDDMDPLRDLAKSVPKFSSDMNNRAKDGNNSKTGINMAYVQNSVGEEPTRKAFAESDASPTETNSQGMSPKPEDNSEAADDIWLTVSEIPLFTQPTSAPPPSRPPPPRPRQASKTAKGSHSAVNTKKANEFSSPRNFHQTYRRPEPVPDSAKSSGMSPMSELEDFAMGRRGSSADEHGDSLSSEEDAETNSTAAASAAAMKEAMDRAEAKFKHAREVRERGNVKVAKNRGFQQERDEKVMQDLQERELREKQERLEREQREREEKEREQRKLEKEKERIEREKARQAVERATKEARDRAAIEARQRAERAAKNEARERAERAAVQRAHAEARERAAADAKERAERTAAEAKERANAEKAAAARAEEARRQRTAVDRVNQEARERAAAEAQQKATATSAAGRGSQQSNDNDLESFFGMGARPSSAPKSRTTSSDSTSYPQFHSRVSPEGSQWSSAGSTSNMRKASSTTNIVDDLTSIFGEMKSSGDFQEQEGETEERRRARLERHQRTQERAKQALAEKNERDLKTQREQAERHRIAETMDAEIKRWAAGKEGNLRALLSTLQYVLWEGSGWQAVSLTDLITGASVKKVYRKATLCVHPDKVQQKGATLAQKYIAEKVFDLLKEAWNKFNSEELF